MSEAAFPVVPARTRHPRLGYSMAALAAVLWGINGAVSKTILSTGLSSERLAQLRSLGAALGLLLVVAVYAPSRLRLTRREVPYLAVFGVAGLAFVQWFYFLAIHRLAIGVALLIEYLAPLLVALWAHFIYHQRVRRRIWLALALALGGLGLIVNLFGGAGKLSGTGIVFALGGAIAYMTYVLLAEHAVGDRDPVSLLGWGFLFASVFWRCSARGGRSRSRRYDARLARVGPARLGVRGVDDRARVRSSRSSLLVSALRHLSATSVGIVAMLEPVAGALIAWAWLGESLDGVQLAGAAVVLAAIVLAQTARGN
jgi:Predicted permease, DMT superfamily